MSNQPNIFQTTVLGVGPWCVEFVDGEIVTCRAEDRARLIAAAPELLASLTDILETFSLGPLGAAAKYGPDVDLRAVEEAAVAGARDAIAKATSGR